MDNRAYAAGYAWSRDLDGAAERTWEFRGERVTLPAGAVRESRHHGYHCLLAKWSGIDTVRVALKYADEAAARGISLATIADIDIKPENIAVTLVDEKAESARIFPEQIKAMTAALAEATGHG